MGHDLLNGEVIRIAGSNFEPAMHRFRCGKYGYVYDVPFDEMVDGLSSACPSCHSTEMQLAPGFGFCIRGRSGCRRGSKVWKSSA